MKPIPSVSLFLVHGTSKSDLQSIVMVRVLPTICLKSDIGSYRVNHSNKPII